MLIKIITLNLLMLFLIPLIISYKKNRDFFAPVVIISFMNIITIVPHLWIISQSTMNVYPLVLYYFGFRGLELDMGIFKFLIIQAVAYLFNLVGIKFYDTVNMNNLKYYRMDMKESKEKLKSGAIILMSIGIIAYLILIYTIGGFEFLFSHIHKRTFLLRGNNYLLSLIDCLIIGVAIYTYNHKYKNTPATRSYLFISIIAGVIIFTSFGGRATSVLLFLIILMIWNYSVDKIKIFTLRNVIIVLLVFIYIIMVPLLRAENALYAYMNDINVLFEQIIKSGTNIIKEISIVDRNLFAINYFSLDNIWYGKSFVDLVYAFIPSSFYPDKPPVDDGVYIWTLVNGIYVEPSLPYHNLLQSSWPLETMGMMYANFWIPGVIVGMFVLGIIQSFTYNLMKNSEFTVFTIILYSYIIYKFDLSNLFITQTLISMTLTFVVMKILFGLKIRKANKKNEKSEENIRK